MEIGFSSDIAIAVESVLLALSALLVIYSVSDLGHRSRSTSPFLILLVVFLFLEILLDLTSFVLDKFCFDAPVKYVLYHGAYLFSNLIPWAAARDIIARVEGNTKTIARVCDVVMVVSNLTVIVGAPFHLFVANVTSTVSTAGPLYVVLYATSFILIAIAIVMGFKIDSFAYLWRFSTLFLGVATVVAALLGRAFPAVPMTVLAQALGVTGFVLTSRSATAADNNLKIAELAAIKAELAEQKNAALVSQIKPHFVQNSLLAIAYLCEEDPTAAKNLTLDFARYLRGNIDSINGKDLIPFTKELDHTKTYLAIERARFGDTFQVVYDIQVDDFLVPPLSLQPLVENAFKHGISPLQEGGTIWISTARDAGKTRITVRDNGIGFNPETEPDNSKSHVGVANTRNRVSRLLGGILNVKTGSNVGTEVTIEIPVRRGKEETL